MRHDTSVRQARPANLPPLWLSASALAAGITVAFGVVRWISHFTLDPNAQDTRVWIVAARTWPLAAGGRHAGDSIFLQAAGRLAGPRRAPGQRALAPRGCFWAHVRRPGRSVICVVGARGCHRLAERSVARQGGSTYGPDDVLVSVRAARRRRRRDRPGIRGAQPRLAAPRPSGPGFRPGPGRHHRFGHLPARGRRGDPRSGGLDRTARPTESRAAGVVARRDRGRTVHRYRPAPPDALVGAALAGAARPRAASESTQDAD